MAAGALLVALAVAVRATTAAVSTAALDATEDKPLLFVDAAVLASASDGLELQVHPPSHGPLVLWPTEPWESWAVFGSNSVVQLRPGDANYSAEASIRMYYDCVEIGTQGHWGQLGNDRSCVAVSPDGVTWIKPRLDIVRYQGQPSNIVANCVSPAVFIDRKPGVPDSQRWKMLCSNTVWAGADGWHFEPMFGAGHKSIQHKDDTMDVGSYDSALAMYVIFVRRDIPVAGKTPSVHRRIGRCETDDLSNWEKFAPANGCESVFGPDALDPDMVDVYTSSWTRYAGIEWFFPTFYHQFPNSNRSSPDGFPNDGLLAIRLAVSRSTRNLSYVATGAGATRVAIGRGAGSPGFRAPFVAWGVNTCGEWAVHPSLPGGWCDVKNGALATTSFDTSGGYMVAGAVDSSDGLEVLTYASGQPFTHGGDIANVTWRNNTGIRLLRSRKHGWVSIAAAYIFNRPRHQMPHLVTKPLLIATDAQSAAIVNAGRNLPRQKLLSLLLNVKTSNVGFVVVELRNASSGLALPGFELNASDPIRTNSVAAAASWRGGELRSLESFKGEELVVVVAMADAQLFSLWFGLSPVPDS